MMEHLSFYSLMLKDVIEISCLSTLCYWCMCWLKQDRQKPLLVYCYLYCFFWIACFLFDLKTLLHLLELTTPVVVMLFILVHQKTLQKNFIGLYKAIPARKVQTLWLEELIRFCLQADQNFMFLIEHKNSIAELLSIGLPLQTDITSTVLTYLCQCKQFNHDQYILLDTQGTLLGLNVTWQKALALYDIEEDCVKKATYCLQEVDAFALYFNHAKREFTLVIHQNSYPALSTAQLLQSIEQYLKTDPIKKGIDHESYNKTGLQQPHA